MEFNRLIPELTVSNLEQSITFYKEILGFKIEYARPERRFAFLSYEGSQIMIDEQKDNDTWSTGKLEYPFGRGINFQIEVKNVDKMIEALKEHKYPIMIMPAEHWYRKDDVLYGSKEFLVMDPDGYLLRFAEDIGTKKVEEQNDNHIH